MPPSGFAIAKGRVHLEPPKRNAAPSLIRLTRIPDKGATIRHPPAVQSASRPASLAHAPVAAPSTIQQLPAAGASGGVASGPSTAAGKGGNHRPVEQKRASRRYCCQQRGIQDQLGSSAIPRAEPRHQGHQHRLPQLAALAGRIDLTAPAVTGAATPHPMRLDRAIGSRAHISMHRRQRPQRSRRRWHRHTDQFDATLRRRRSAAERRSHF